MKCRLYQPSDYPLVRLWWQGHKTAEVSEVILPKLGVMVESEQGHPVAVAWAYMDNSTGVAWMAWITTNPALKRTESVKALKILVGGVEVALPREYGVLFTETKSLGVTRFLKRLGYSLNHSAVQLFKVIKR